MDVENIMTSSKPQTIEKEEEEEEEPVPLPGFRFHPTDEELVGFYLRRKIEKKPIGMELIKQADIYKYDPWDLPKSTNSGEREKEWYFFCKRGRKYKNSVRPNRVTGSGSGFWKATGIDRPIYSGPECIGLKKSLVYYRGSAGKGSKTEWMMHEFRLPGAAQEAEVWTLCRILKRSMPSQKYLPDLRVAVKKINNINNQLLVDQNGKSNYISFSGPIFKQNMELYSSAAANIQEEFHLSSESEAPLVFVPSFADYNVYNGINELLRHADWEDIQSLLNCPAMYL